MTVERCGLCGEVRGPKHAERCRGPRLRQPVHAPWDWAGLMADQDTYDLRGAGFSDEAELDYAEMLA